MKKRLTIELKELQFLLLRCSKCKAELILDMERSAQVPYACAGCNAIYDERLIREPLDGFKNWYRSLRNSDNPQIGFVIENSD